MFVVCAVILSSITFLLRSHEKSLSGSIDVLDKSFYSSPYVLKREVPDLFWQYSSTGLGKSLKPGDGLRDCCRPITCLKIFLDGLTS